MNMGKARQHLSTAWLSALLTICVVGSASAAPGTLATKPIYVNQSVKPNIVFLLDDSGSMAWAELLNSGVPFEANGALIRSGGTLYYTIPTSDRTITRNYPIPNETVVITIEQQKLLLCRGYNVMAYDPGRIYLPPKRLEPVPIAGVTTYEAFDGNGAAYREVDSTVDVTDHVYYVWTDSDNDKEYDAGECGTATAVTPANLPNYRNWYTYHRTRELSMKYAMKDVVHDSGRFRIGLRTINNNNSVSTNVADMGDPGLKNTLMTKINSVNSKYGTALRSVLQGVGEYYKGVSSPILSNTDGGQCQRNFAVVLSDGYWNGDTDLLKTLADIATDYHDPDLKPSIADNVPTTLDDINAAQHMDTYTVAFGVKGDLTCTPGVDGCAETWPTTVTENTPATIDDMHHAAINGKGKFMSAADPDALVTSLQNALSDFSAAAGTLAPVTFNTTSLTDNSLIYQASFNTAGWTGDLTATKITSAGIGDTTEWSAAAKLDAMAPGDRTIYTYNGTEKKAFNAWVNLTGDQRKDINIITDDTETAGLGVINYIRGDQSNEGTNTGQFRVRTSRLGDIVNSAPVYVGKPNARYPDSIEGSDKLYSTFAATNSDRTGRVYVGANDGMLHAFDAATGAEAFTYIPDLVFSAEPGKGLHALAEQGYAHNPYVDLTVATADVYNSGWKTVVVGGLRGGGKGIFALDVTSEGLDSVLFEYTHNDLGYTYSEIQVARMNNGKWAAIFGNGYNSDPDGDGKAKLFIVYLDDGTETILDTGVGSLDATSKDCANAGSDCNGMSTPNIGDLDGDGTIDRIFSGDLHGNLWVFNVSDPLAGNWTSAYKTSGGTALPLAIACRGTLTPDTNGPDTCATADRQPITSKPSIAWHPSQNGIGTQPNVMAFFGTGQFLTNNDLTTTATQRFFGVWDNGGSGEYTSTDLQKQTITTTSHSSGDVRIIDSENSETPVNYPTKKGWYMDLPTSKERVVTNPLVYGDLVLFTTLIPGEGGDNPCDEAGGAGWLMAVEMGSGGAPVIPSMDLTGDGDFNSDDNVSDGAVVVVGKPSSNAPTESRLLGNMRCIPGTCDLLQGTQPITSRSSWTVY